MSIRQRLIADGMRRGSEKCGSKLDRVIQRERAEGAHGAAGQGNQSTATVLQCGCVKGCFQLCRSLVAIRADSLQHQRAAHGHTAGGGGGGGSVMMTRKLQRCRRRLAAGSTHTHTLTLSLTKRPFGPSTRKIEHKNSLWNKSKVGELGLLFWTLTR